MDVDANTCKVNVLGGELAQEMGTKTGGSYCATRLPLGCLGEGAISGRRQKPIN
jgi:hypothetical protein